MHGSDSVNRTDILLILMQGNLNLSNTNTVTDTCMKIFTNTDTCLRTITNTDTDTNPITSVLQHTYLVGPRTWFKVYLEPV